METVLRNVNIGGGALLSTPANSFGVFSRRKKSGFTLAEMMVVMLIMSIILAAMAPVMTTRNKSDYSSPWRYSTNGSDAYFGAGEQQVALIGQHDTTGDDADTKLLINVADNSTFSHILFKQGASILGRLSLDQRNNLYLSNTRPNENSERNTTVGIDALKNNTEGVDNTAIGFNSLTSNTEGGGNVAIGSNSMQSNTTGHSNTAIGRSSLSDMTNSSHNNIAIGSYSNWRLPGEANSSGWTPRGTIAIGSFSSAQSEKSIAIGTGTYSNEAVKATTAFGTNSIALGAAAHAGLNAAGTIVGTNATAIGFSSQALSNYSIAIGSETRASSQYSVAIGDESETYGSYSLAIGPYLAKAYGANSIAIGREAFAGVEDDGAINNAIAMGYNSHATGYNSISIGSQSIASGNYAIAIGSLGYNSVEDSEKPAQAIGAQSIAVGIDSKTSEASSIAIGNGADVNEANGIAIGTTSKASSNGVALGAFANAGDSIGAWQNTAIGAYSCRNLNGATNKTCIGFNSGPKSDSDWARDDIERIFIGSQSKFDGGTAVLEVHNDLTEEGKLLQYGDINKTAVVVHGALVVTGPIYNRVKYENKDQNYDWRLLEQKWTYAGAVGDEEGSAVWAHGTTGPFYKDYINDVSSSDRRLKYVGKENTSGLDKIRQLKVFNYTFKKDEKKTPHVGVIAQDLQKVFPDAVKKGVDGFLTIRMEDMFYAVINAIKELDIKYQAQEKRINELEKRIDKLEAKIK